MRCGLLVRKSKQFVRLAWCKIPRMTDILIGTSAFTADGWYGSFYPKGLHQRDYLSYYAAFDKVRALSYEMSNCSASFLIVVP
jgi:hypothetical protein